MTEKNKHKVRGKLMAALESNRLETMEDILCFQAQVNQILDDLILVQFGPDQSSLLQAQDLEVTFIDQGSGRLHRRTLPLEIEESNNALRLIGEKANGQTTEIVFFSQQGLTRIQDLMGKGPDQPHHDHDKE